MNARLSKSLIMLLATALFFMTGCKKDNNPQDNAFKGLCFTAREAGSTLGITPNGTLTADIEYSTDGVNWIPFVAGNTEVAFANVGDVVCLRGENPNGLSQDEANYMQFRMTGALAASGSIMSLIDNEGKADAIPNEYCFSRLFKDCIGLTEAPKLPAVNLTEACYFEMFAGCAGLTKAPNLPAKTLAEHTYMGMFKDCTNLTTAPEIAATELILHCCEEMFANCTKLVKAPALHATTLSEGCYWSMFLGCSALEEAPELPATELACNCYGYMFMGCTSLTEAPELPATALKDYCYCNMFKGCTNLTEAPELHGAILTEGCYSSMFEGCSNLNKIKAHFTEWNDEATYYWTKDVASSGTFLCLEVLPQQFGESYIPNSWNVETF